MALMPAIMSLFGKNTPTAPAATPDGTEGSNSTIPNQNTPVSTGNPAAIPAIGKGDQSPLAGFAELWKVDPNAPKPASPASLVPTFNLDGKVLMEQAGKLNYTNHLSEDLVTKAMSGDKEAFLGVLNQVAQLGFAHNSAASANLIAESFGNANTALNDSIIPQAIRRQQVSSAISENNPIFSDPAVAPMMSMLQNQFAAKYPTSSPAEIAAMAATYLDGMAGRIVEAKGGSIVSPSQTRQGIAQQDPDWIKLLGG